ncbi:MAG: serine hydrolase [Acidobacteria bacterium]|nr:serine hydrolase [Acidobacteriota bacterium]
MARHPGAFRQRFSSADRKRAGRAVVEPLLKQFNVPGVSIAISKDFTVAATYPHGVADVESGAPVTTGTMLQAASSSSIRPVTTPGSTAGTWRSRRRAWNRRGCGTRTR